MTLYFRRRLLFRVLALLMMFLILALVSVVPIMQASALAPVIAYGAKELVAALLIAGGASFATSDEAREAATKVWDWLGQNAADTAGKIEQLIQQQIEISETLGNGAIRISSSIWDVLQTAWNFYFPSSGVNYGVEYRVEEGKWNSDMYYGVFSYGEAWQNAITSIYVPESDVTFSVSPSYVQAGEEYFVYRNGVSQFTGIATKSGYVYLFAGFASSGSWGKVRAALFHGDSYNTATRDVGGFSLPASLYFYSDVASPGLVYPGEDTMIYVPDIPEVQTDEEGKDVVIWPDLSLNPDDFVLDIPKTATGDLVDVPYDTLVDASTGTAVGEGEGTGTGEGEGTGSGILDILGDIWDAIRNFFDSPSDFKLDFDGFKNLILVDRFPFCIPFDLRDAIMLFAASAADYRFSIDLDTAYFSVHHTVDLSPYTVPITFFRYVVVVWFVYVLILRTRDVMKW